MSAHRIVAAVVICSCVVACAQQPNLEPDRPADKPVPTVTFDFVSPDVNPQHYSIAVDATGRAAYHADDPAEVGKTGEPCILKFTIPESLSRRIFDLARQANYFQGNFDYKKSQIADTGTKTLTYAEGPENEIHLGQPATGRRYQTSYNWSQNHVIQQLTDIYQSIAETIEFGRKLEFQRRFDKLGLANELSSMEGSGRLLAVQAIAPVLEQIASDPAVMNVARERASICLRRPRPSATFKQVKGLTLVGVRPRWCAGGF